MKSLGSLAGIKFVGQIGARALQYLLFIFIGREFGAGTLGVVAFGTMILGLGSIVPMAGLDTAVLKFLPRNVNEEDDDVLAGTVLLSLAIPLSVGGILSTMLYLGFPYFESLTSASFGSGIKLFILMLPIYSAMQVGRAATRGFKDTKYDVFIDLGQSLVLLSLVVVSARYTADPWYIGLAFLLSAVVGLGLTLWYLFTLGAFQFDDFPTFPLKKLLLFSLPVVLMSVGTRLLSWTDTFMLGLYTTTSVIGKYHSAYKTALILTMVLTAVNSIFPPIASELYDNNRIKQLQETYSVLSKWIFSLTLLGYVFIVVFGDWMLGIFGAEFTTAWTMLVVLGFGQVVAASVGPVGFLLLMAGNERIEIINTWIAAVANVVLNMVLIVQYGILGAAFATSISIVLVNALRVGQVYHQYSIHPFSRGHLVHGASIAATIPLFLAGSRLQLVQESLQVVLTGALALSIHVAILWFVGLNERDRILLESID